MEASLDELRWRVGVERALAGIVAEPEIARGLGPAVEHVLTRLVENHGLRETASLTAYEPLAFSATFRRAAGISFFEFVDRARVDASLLRLATTDDPVESIARDYGFLSRLTLTLSIEEYTGLPLAAVLSLLRP